MEVFDRADEEGRALSYQERQRVEGFLKRAKAAKDVDDRVREIDGDLGESGRGVGGNAFGGPGDLFVKSEGFKSIQDPDSRSQSWSTGAVDVGFLSKAGTLLESGQGAGLIPAPQVLPGAVTTLFETLSVASLFASGVATTSSVRYVNEGTAVSGAAGVAEGGAKPPSDLTYSTVDEPVKKIATSLTVSDELLDDVSNVSQFVNGRLSLFVRIEEERQLLRGTGTNELVGILGRSINTYSRGTVDNNAACLAKVIANTRGSSFLSLTRSSCIQATGWPHGYSPTPLDSISAVVRSAALTAIPRTHPVCSGRLSGASRLS
ncbi:MAG: phage major capsid protein [Actinomycetota bacterium]